MTKRQRTRSAGRPAAARKPGGGARPTRNRSRSTGPVNFPPPAKSGSVEIFPPLPNAKVASSAFSAPPVDTAASDELDRYSARRPKTVIVPAPANAKVASPPGPSPATVKVADVRVALPADEQLWTELRQITRETAAALAHGLEHYLTVSIRTAQHWSHQWTVAELTVLDKCAEQLHIRLTGAKIMREELDKRHAS